MLSVTKTRREMPGTFVISGSWRKNLTVRECPKCMEIMRVSMRVVSKRGMDWIMYCHCLVCGEAWYE